MPLRPTSGSSMRVLVLALLSLPLAGCFGVTWPPPPLPDWAMHPQAEAARPAGASARRVASRRPPGEAGVASRTSPGPKADGDVLPFSTEWQAREEALDTHLRRTMNICRGC